MGSTLGKKDTGGRPNTRTGKQGKSNERSVSRSVSRTNKGGANAPAKQSGQSGRNTSTSRQGGQSSLRKGPLKNQSKLGTIKDSSKTPVPGRKDKKNKNKQQTNIVEEETYPSDLEEEDIKEAQINLKKNKSQSKIKSRSSSRSQTRQVPPKIQVSEQLPELTVSEEDQVAELTASSQQPELEYGTRASARGNRSRSRKEGQEQGHLTTFDKVWSSKDCYPIN